MFAFAAIRPLLTLTAAASVALSALLGTAPSSPGSAPQRAHVVRAGETLWSIAVRAYPDEDPRLAVDEIARANHMSTSTIRLGERIVLP